MASGNGKEIEALEQQWLSGQPMPPPSPRAQEVQAEDPSTRAQDYDLMARMRDTAQAMREMASYNSQVAADLERFATVYHGHMQRLLGR